MKKESDLNLTLQIQKKNDDFRKTFSGGKVFLTRSVQTSALLPQILRAVQTFSDFNKDNDPHWEHDFGSVIVNEQKYFWKIDYYDNSYEFFKEDENRILTIMEASEY